MLLLLFPRSAARNDAHAGQTPVFFLGGELVALLIRISIPLRL